MFMQGQVLMATTLRDALLFFFLLSEFLRRQPLMHIEGRSFSTPSPTALPFKDPAGKIPTSTALAVISASPYFAPLRMRPPDHRT